MGVLGYCLLYFQNNYGTTTLCGNVTVTWCLVGYYGILHRNKNYEQRRHLSVIGVLKKVDTPTIFFFLNFISGCWTSISWSVRYSG